MQQVSVYCITLSPALSKIHSILLHSIGSCPTSYVHTLYPLLKGTVSRDEYIILNFLTIKRVIFEWALMVFTIFSCLFVEKIQKKTLPVTLFRGTEVAIWNRLQKPACGLKYHTGSCLGHEQLCGFFLHPMRGVDTGENWPMTGREASTKIMMLLLEQILELASACFQRSN